MKASLVCPQKELWQARSQLVKMISSEALRVAKEKWPSPPSAELQRTCFRVEDRLNQSGEGSVLFIGLNSLLFQKIASFSHSWVSHTGVAMKEEGSWVIYESRAPRGLSHPTPLCAFIARAIDHRVALAQPRVPLTSEQVELLRTTLKQKLPQKYDFSFNLENPQGQFCSKLVYESFQELGLNFGEPLTLKELVEENGRSKGEVREMACFFKAWFQVLHPFNGVAWENLTLPPADLYKEAAGALQNPQVPFVLVSEGL